MSASTVSLWLLRVAWALLALVAAPAFAQALDGRSGAVQVVAAAGLWAGWVVVLGATLVPAPVSLTLLRMLAPGALAAAIVAAFCGAAAAAAVAAIGLALVAVIVALTAEVGAAFVQAGAYGDEARFLLRPPGPLLAGPIELAWLVLAVAVGAGPLLLAARSWVAGAVVTVLAIALAVRAGAPLPPPHPALVRVRAGRRRRARPARAGRHGHVQAGRHPRRPPRPRHHAGDRPHRPGARARRWRSIWPASATSRWPARWLSGRARVRRSAPSSSAPADRADCWPRPNGARTWSTDANSCAIQCRHGTCSASDGEHAGQAAVAPPRTYSSARS